MVTNEDQHTTLFHVLQTLVAPVVTVTAEPVVSVTAAPVTSGDIITSAVVISTQAPPTNEGVTPSVLTGAVCGGAILLIMIVSTLVVILMVKRKRTRQKARDSVSSCTGISNNMCIVVHTMTAPRPIPV